MADATLSNQVARFESYVRADPHNAKLWLNLADLYHRAGRLDEAIASFERCLTESPNERAAMSGIASVLISLHHFDQAEKRFRELIAQEPDNAVLRHNLGIALIYQERWSDAREQFEQAKQLGLHDARNLAYLARALHHLGKMPEAIEACQQWLQLAGSAEAKAYLALLYMDDGRMDLAQPLAAQVLVEAPDQIDASIVVGNAAIENQDMEKAAAEFRRTLQAQPQNGRGWLGLGLVHLYQEKHAEAIEALDRAVRLMPQNSGTIVALGWARLANRDARGAQDTFEQAIRVDRSFAEAHGGFATALAFQNKVDAAREAARVATRLDPANFGGAFANSILLTLQGKTVQAKERLAKLLHQSPAAGAKPLIDHLLLFAKQNPKWAKGEHAGQGPRPAR